MAKPLASAGSYARWPAGLPINVPGMTLEPPAARLRPCIGGGFDAAMQVETGAGADVVVAAGFESMTPSSTTHRHALGSRSGSVEHAPPPSRRRTIPRRRPLGVIAPGCPETAETLARYTGITREESDALPGAQPCTRGRGCAMASSPTNWFASRCRRRGANASSLRRDEGISAETRIDGALRGSRPVSRGRRDRRQRQPARTTRRASLPRVAEDKLAELKLEPMAWVVAGRPPGAISSAHGPPGRCSCRVRKLFAPDRTLFRKDRLYPWSLNEAFVAAQVLAVSEGLGMERCRSSHFNGCVISLGTLSVLRALLLLPPRDDAAAS